MVLAAGAEVDAPGRDPPAAPRLQAVVDRWPLDSVLAALQILAEARGRLRGSPHGRLLVELALARVARLEDLGEIGELDRPAGRPGIGGGAVALERRAGRRKKKASRG